MKPFKSIKSLVLLVVLSSLFLCAWFDQSPNAQQQVDNPTNNFVAPISTTVSPLSHNIAPFEFSPDKYTDDKLPPLYAASSIQSHVTAANYSMTSAKCSRTLILIKTARSNSVKRDQMRRQLRKVSQISNHYFVLGQAIDLLLNSSL